MSKQTQFPKVSILGLELDQIERARVAETIVDHGKNSTASGYVVRPHVVFIEAALKQPKLMQLLNNSQFCLVDGVALQWASFYLKHPGYSTWHLTHSLSHIPRRTKKLRSVISDRYAGPEFTLNILKTCAKTKARVFLIGSPQKRSIGHTASFLSKAVPGLNIVGSYAVGRDGQRVFLDAAREAVLLSALKRQRPDVILIGMGFPSQEEAMQRLSSKLSHGIFIGEGGSFDYKEFGGHITRAPVLLRKAGLEWLWRLGRQPKRLKRHLAIPRFIRHVHIHKRKQK